MTTPADTRKPFRQPHEFTIYYKDGDTQPVTITKQEFVDGWLLFFDGTSLVLRVQGDEVSSVRRYDVPERQRPAHPQAA